MVEKIKNTSEFYVLKPTNGLQSMVPWLLNARNNVDNHNLLVPFAAKHLRTLTTITDYPQAEGNFSYIHEAVYNFAKTANESTQVAFGYLHEKFAVFSSPTSDDRVLAVPNATIRKELPGMQYELEKHFIVVATEQGLVGKQESSPIFLGMPEDYSERADKIDLASDNLSESMGKTKTFHIGVSQAISGYQKAKEPMARYLALQGGK